jgi:hypothetical protein
MTAEVSLAGEAHCGLESSSQGVQALHVHHEQVPEVMGLAPGAKGQGDAAGLNASLWMVILFLNSRILSLSGLLKWSRSGSSVTP